MTAAAAGQGRLRRRRRAGAAAFLLVAGLIWAPPAVATRPAPGMPSSYAPSLSSDGRFVAFASVASTLVDGDDNNTGDIFVRDTVAGTTTIIPESGSDRPDPDPGRFGPVISADGDHLLFTSPRSAGTALFRRDLRAGTTERVDVPRPGTPDTALPFAVLYDLSADGRYVVFSSTQATLVADDTNDEGDVFVRDMTSGVTSRVSVTSTGGQLRFGAEQPAISGDGRFVAFTSGSPELVGANGDSQVFVRDLRTGATEAVSVDRDGGTPNGPSVEADLSRDGRFVSFTSLATDLLGPGDRTKTADVFVRDRLGGTTVLVSASAAGTPAEGDSVSSQLSADGRAVAFLSDASDLPGATTRPRRQNLYVRDLDTSTTRLVNARGSGAAAALGDPTFSLAADGALVAFSSADDRLVVGDTNGAADVFVRDVAAADPTLVSVATDGEQGRNCYWSQSDAAVGLPAYRSSTGAVHADLTSNPPAVLTLDDLGAGPGTPDDRFGASVTTQNLSGYLDDNGKRGCADLVVGAPGAGADDAGRVFVAFNSVRGLGAVTPTITLAPDAGASGDGFGTAVRAITVGDDGRRRITAVFVGRPGRDVNGAQDAGAVERFDITYDRDTDQATVARRDPLTQDSPGVPGRAEAGDRFGEILGTGTDAVVVGVPHEDVGTASDAGLVAVLPLDAGTPAVNVTQDSPGMAGRAETGDRFGAALGGLGCETLVGVPGEDVGRVRDAGMVQWFRVPPCVSKPLVAGPAQTQDSPRVPGVAEAGDRFGAAVVAGRGEDEGFEFTVIGAPGEDIGARRDAGSLVIEQYLCDTACRPRALRQGDGLPGSPEAGDRLGATLALRTSALGDLTAYGFLIGVPGEDVGPVVDAGLVHDGLTRTISLPDGPVSGMRYGSVIADTFH